MLQNVLAGFGFDFTCNCTGRDKRRTVPALGAQCWEGRPSKDSTDGVAVPRAGLDFNPSVADFGDDFESDVDSSELPYLQSYDHGGVGDASWAVDSVRQGGLTDSNYKSSLDQCARKLQRSAIKVRHSLEGEDHPVGVNDEILGALRSTEYYCKGFLKPSDIAPRRLRGFPRGAIGSKSVAMSTTSLPSICTSFSTLFNRTDAPNAHDGTGSNSRGFKIERVDSEYERRDVEFMIKGLRQRMRDKGVLPEEHFATKAEVQVYQQAMRSKLEAIGVPDMQAQQFRDTTKPIEAVRDAVAKYHSHCHQKLGRLYAVPGDEPETNCLRDKNSGKSENYVRVLTSDPHFKWQMP